MAVGPAPDLGRPSLRRRLEGGVVFDSLAVVVLDGAQLVPVGVDPGYPVRRRRGWLQLPVLRLARAGSVGGSFPAPKKYNGISFKR